MKKIYKLLIITLLLFLSACTVAEKTNGNGNGDNNINNNVENKPVKITEKNNNEEGSSKIEDYTKINKDLLYKFKGTGSEFASQDSYVEYIDEDKMQVKIFNSATNTVKVFQNKDGEYRELYSESEFYNIENLLNVEEDNYNILLKEPLQVGNTWQTSEGKSRSITGIDVDIELPYEKLKALEVTTELGDGVMQLDYYVIGMGHVASIYKDGDFKIETLLEKVVKGPIEKNIRYFYPLADGTNLVYKDKKILFNTNDKIEDLIEEGIKNPENESLVGLMSKESEINSLKYDRLNNLLRADLNKGFLEYNMSMGSSYEYEVLQALTNTLGRFYQVNKVAITIDGEPYSSGHYEFEKDDYIETTDNALRIVD